MLQTVTSPPYQEHPLDVLNFLTEQENLGHACALAMLTATQGGAVRAPGALMAITDTGKSCGYLSGGCIDADVRLQACTAIKSRTVKYLRYGEGSPFFDITLPCSGALDLVIIPAPEREKIQQVIDALTSRRAAHLSFSSETEGFIAHYRPKLCLRIAGRSQDAVTLAHISQAAGFETSLWSQDEECLARVKELPAIQIVKLISPSSLANLKDDAETAFVLMMHDAEWEIPLLKQALSGPAFYVGAVGSSSAHAKRISGLAATGVVAASLARIKGPIGLVPSVRDASMLAISTLAEIIKMFQAAGARQKVYTHV